MDSWKGEFLMTNTKKKHGNKMKLMSAIGMLTVSAAMLVSSTFAWFSMNKKVTASTMSISAKSDSTFLLIGTGNNDTAGEIQTAKSTSADIGTAEQFTQLIPSTPAVAADLTTYATELAGSAAVTNKATAEVEANWWTANSSDPANATTNTINVTPLTSTNFDEYVIKRTVYLTVAVGANQANSLTIKPTFTAQSEDQGKVFDGIKVLVATSDGVMTTLTNTQSGSAVSIQGTNNITSAGVLTVDLYIYYDGKDSTVYSNNYANLTGADVEFEFSVEPVTT
jgi:hypothetical protein